MQKLYILFLCTYTMLTQGTDQLATGAEKLTRSISAHIARSKQRRQILSGHTSVVSCAIMPNPTTICSSSWDKTVRIWDATSGQTNHILNAHTAPVNQVIQAMDHTIASASSDTTVRIWDIETGQCEQVLGAAAYVRSLAYKESKLAIGADNIIYLCDPRNPSSNIGHLQHARTVTCLWHPTSTTLISGSLDGTLREWDIRQYKKPPIHVYKVQREIYGLAGSYPYAAAGTEGTNLHIVDIKKSTSTPLSIKEVHHTYALDFLNEQTLIFAGEKDRQPVLCVINTGTSAQQPVTTDHTDLIASVHYIPATDSLISASKDTTIHVQRDFQAKLDQMQ